MDIRRLGATAGLLGAAALVAALGAGPLLVTGADHLDAPGVKADKRTDITDVYAFASQGGTTLALNINPLTSPADTAGARLSDTALYQFLIDTNADAKADIAYRLRFSKPWTRPAMARWSSRTSSSGQPATRPAPTSFSGDLVATGKTTAYGQLGQGRVDQRRRQGIRRSARRSVLLRPAGLHRVQEPAARGVDRPRRPAGRISPVPTRSPARTSAASSSSCRMRAWGERVRPLESGPRPPSESTASTSRSTAWPARPSTRSSTTRAPTRTRPTAAARPVTVPRIAPASWACSRPSTTSSR